MAVVHLPKHFKLQTERKEGMTRQEESPTTTTQWGFIVFSFSVDRWFRIVSWSGWWELLLVAWRKSSRQVDCFGGTHCGKQQCTLFVCMLCSLHFILCWNPCVRIRQRFILWVLSFDILLWLWLTNSWSNHWKEQIEHETSQNQFWFWALNLLHTYYLHSSRLKVQYPNKQSSEVLFVQQSAYWQELALQNVNRVKKNRANIPSACLFLLFSVCDKAGRRNVGRYRFLQNSKLLWNIYHLVMDHILYSCWIQ